jgi:hypothetical protein
MYLGCNSEHVSVASTCLSMEEAWRKKQKLMVKTVALKNNPNFYVNNILPN